jgi:enoyl-CoA hydratase
MKEFSTISFKEVETGIGLVILNRPERLNAISVTMLADFAELFDHLSQNDKIRVIVITGEGRGFCAGADLSDALAFKDTEAFSEPESYLRIAQERYSNLILGLRKIPQPIVAAINGPAAGGGFAVALASDIRLASPEAYFVASFINIGLSGGELGCSYFLPRLVGLSHAADILYTGRKVKADEAERIGLVSRVVPREELVETALSYARIMQGKSTGGLRLTKRVLDQNIDAPSLEAAINLENRNQTIMVFSGEFLKLIEPFSKGGKG